MEDYHKVRIYHDFPILFDYLRNTKKVRIPRFRSSKKVKIESKNNLPLCKVNSVAFTRKIIDLQKSEDDYLSVNPENFILDHFKCITSKSQNHYHLIQSDGSLYFVDQHNQTVIGESSSFFCKRIDPFEEEKSPTLYSTRGFTIECQNSEETFNLFSDFIEEEYKTLPKCLPQKYHTIIHENKVTNNFISEDNRIEGSSICDQDAANKVSAESPPRKILQDEKSSLINDNDTIDAPLPIPGWEELCERVYQLDHPLDWNSSKLDHNAMKSLHFSQNNSGLCHTSPTSSGTCDSYYHDPSKDTDIINFIFNETIPSYPIENLETKMPLHQNSNEIGTTLESDVFMENFDLKTFVCQQSKRIFHLRKEIVDRSSCQQNNDTNSNLEYLIEQLPISESNDDQIISSQKSLLFDLCKETILKMFQMEIVPSESNKLTLMLPLKMQRQPWPLDENIFAQTVFESIEKTLNIDQNVNKSNLIYPKNPNNIKRFGLMAYCRMQRKLDFVDQLLYQEMLQEQARWSYFEPEILEIKNLICDMILEESICATMQSLAIHQRHEIEK